MITIRNGYLVTDRDAMRAALQTYREMYPSEYPNRSDISMIREWEAHNLLFCLGFFIDHTQDVDFEDEQNFFVSVAFFFLSGVYVLLRAVRVL